MSCAKCCDFGYDFVLERFAANCCPQVYWLLLAMSQDQPKNTHIAELRDRCERAALEGYWVIF